MQDTIPELIDPLSIELKDEVLATRLKKRISDYTKYLNEKNLRNTWEQNEKYLFGEQILNKDYASGNDPKYLDNVIWEGENSIKPIALSKTPDLIVYPAADTDEARQTAERLTKIVNHDLKRREIRKTAGIAHKHLPVYLSACIKAVWNPEKGEHGDYEFVIRNPKNIVYDITATSNEVEHMSYVFEKITNRTVEELVRMFPRDKVIKALNWNNAEWEKDANMATKPEHYECWFIDYKDGEDDTVEKVYAVAWMLNGHILKKIKHPYHDFKGYSQTFVYDPFSNKERKATEEDYSQAMMASMMGGEAPQMMDKLFYRNYFSSPRFPFIFLGYEQWGESPFDRTSRIMQNIPKQDNINLRGKQISKINDKANSKPVFSKQSNIQASDIEEFLNDDDGVLFIDGKINETYATFGGDQAGQSLNLELSDARQRAFATAGVNATTRGIVETDTATVGQIARESDYGRIDDLKFETIDYLYSRMAEWSLQFIKLFYTKEHLRRVMGIDGDLAFEAVNQDLVEDGVEVDIKASSVDKVKRERDAKEDAQIGMSDPLSYFEDLERPNPKERAKRVMLLKLNPELYMQQILGGVNSQPTAQALEQMPIDPESPPQAPPEAPPEAPQPPMSEAQPPQMV
jgi:hypothetical protein